MKLKKILLSAVSCIVSGTLCMAQGTDLGGLVSGRLLTEESLVRPVEFLTDTLCEGRATFTRGGVEAGFWILRQFKHFGLLPLRQPSTSSSRRTMSVPESGYVRSFVSDGKVGHNIIGMCPSSVPSDKYVIVAAHYDNLGLLSGRYYPGADSNASGVSVILNLAHLFRSAGVLGHSAGSNILFVAFDGKQLSMAGSNAFYDSLAGGMLVNPVNGHAIRPEQVFLMVNIDIIGGTSEPVHKGRTDYLLMLTDDAVLRSRMSEVNMTSRLSMDVAYDYYGSKDFTDLFYRRVGDQKVFIEHGIPTVLFTSGITMKTNKVDDDTRNIDIPVLHRRTLLIFRWLERILASL